MRKITMDIDYAKLANLEPRYGLYSSFVPPLTYAIMGILRETLLDLLSFLIDLLSHAAIIGFMGGAAITIALQRLKGFLGIAKFTTKTDIIHVMESVWKMCIMDIQE
ncbi:Sulfate transporter 1.2 [Acorus gramineus]|uniref:Sulfate transporter 1.2 n=1 Tax=Acorus gramineus TaxID=55184 RepID=A0AAV9A3Q8_ACOGR|nr:Sulfate transporter 1.2 [Acorus gramineus]